MAGRRLSETNELVELVLQYLPVHEIFYARAVSRQWESLIESSLPLRRATFRASYPRELVTLTQDSRQPHFTVPLTHRTDKLTLNPFLRQYEKKTTKLPSSWKNDSDTTSSDIDWYRMCFGSVLTLAVIKTSIWSKTFLTQPPVSVVFLRVKDALSDWNHIFPMATLRIREGITIADVVNTFEQILQSAADGQFTRPREFVVHFTVAAPRVPISAQKFSFEPGDAEEACSNSGGTNDGESHDGASEVGELLEERTISGIEKTIITKAKS